MRKKLLFAATMFVALLFSSCEGGNNPSGQGENNHEHGMYVGITGFSDNVEFYGTPNQRYQVLRDWNLEDYTSFINSLSMGDATVLYYAVDNNISYLQNCTFPDDLSSVNIITFTDGLNQGSRALDKQNGNHDYAANDKSYVAEVNRKIKNIKVQGLPINAYAIGIRGKDVSGDAISTFQDNLLQLSSSKENAMEVSNMEEVSAKFKEIAASLYSKSESSNLTITIPMPSENEKERFTFDNVTDATASKCYIEGVYANGALTNITYVGCMSNSGTEVAEQEAGLVKIKFEFINFTDERGNAVSTTYMQQWHMEPGQTTWTRNSEFKPDESIDIKEEHKTAVVMLILDCSSSLGSDFSKVKAAANDFIKTLAGETVDNPWTDPDPQSTNESQVRFCKEKAYEYVLTMSIEKFNGEDWAGTEAEYEFGTASGTSNYYNISSGNLSPMFYYDDGTNSGWYVALDTEFYYFASNKKYTYTCSDDGSSLTFSIKLDGNANAPARVVASRKIRKTDISSLPKIRK